MSYRLQAFGIQPLPFRDISYTTVASFMSDWMDTKKFIWSKPREGGQSGTTKSRVDLSVLETSALVEVR